MRVPSGEKTAVSPEDPGYSKVKEGSPGFCRVNWRNGLLKKRVRPNRKSVLDSWRGFPCRMASSAPVPASQIRASAPSEEVVTTRAPSGEKTAASTPVSLESTVSSRPVAASQIRAVPSLDVDRIRPPSGEKAILTTGNLWPGGSALLTSIAVSQRRTVSSDEAVAMRAPSGEKTASFK